MLNVISKLENGYEKVTKIIKAGGITTIADMEVCTKVWDFPATARVWV